MSRVGSFRHQFRFASINFWHRRARADYRSLFVLGGCEKVACVLVGGMTYCRAVLGSLHDIISVQLVSAVVRVDVTYRGLRGE